MNTSNNQLHQSTERKIREALLHFMAQEEIPSVGQICAMAGINRSTFYRHYTDIHALLEQTEQEIQLGLLASVERDGTFYDRLLSSPQTLEPLIAYIGENRAFYLTYLRKQGGIPLKESFRQFWEMHMIPLFRQYGIENESHMRYYFSYAEAGFMMVIRSWLEGGCAEPPAEMARILYRMMPAKGSS